MILHEEDSIHVKISLVKGISRRGKKVKLNPRYVRQFEVLEEIVRRAYRLSLPPTYQGLHDVFHISQLKKYLYDPSHVIKHEPVEI